MRFLFPQGAIFYAAYANESAVTSLRVKEKILSIQHYTRRASGLQRYVNRPFSDDFGLSPNIRLRCHVNTKHLSTRLQSVFSVGGMWAPLRKV